MADLRGRLVRRWLILGWIPHFRRMALLERYYGHFLGKGSLASLPRRPDCHFVATSLATGRVTSFSREGFHDGSRIHPATDISVAYAVAASSAFPALFPALEITRKRLRADVNAFPLGTDYLTDGGVFDNLGVARLRELRSSHSASGEAFTLISNASAPFDWTPEPLPTIAHRTARTTDILMARVAELETKIRGAEADNILELGITSIGADDDKTAGVTFQGQSSLVQSQVAKIRTDLDEFSSVEICSLVRHGYEVALSRLREAGLIPEEFRPLDPCVVGYPAIGWPFKDSLIANVPKLRVALGVGTVTGKVWRDGYNIHRKYAAGLGQVSAPPLSRDETAERRIVRDLSKSSLRKLRLWNASDPFCWIVITAICAIAATFWFSTKHLVL